MDDPDDDSPTALILADRKRLEQSSTERFIIDLAGDDAPVGQGANVLRPEGAPPPPPPGPSFFDRKGNIVPESALDGQSTQVAKTPWQRRLNSLQARIPEWRDNAGAYPDEPEWQSELQEMERERQQILDRYQPEGFIDAGMQGGAGADSLAGGELDDVLFPQDGEDQPPGQPPAPAQPMAPGQPPAPAPQSWMKPPGQAPVAGGPPVPRGVLGTADAVVRDVMRGVTELPVQAVGGAMDALSAAGNGIAQFDEWAQSKLGLPKLRILDEDGNFDVRVIATKKGEIVPSVARLADAILPDVRPAASVTGGLVRGISQFLTGFVGGSKALGAIGGVTNAARAGRAMGAAAISDFAAFDGHQERLADLVQSYPALQNPVTEFLASNIDDSEFEGRMKNVLEGVVSDIALSGVISAVRGIRAARRARDEIGAENFADAADRLANDPDVTRRFNPPDTTQFRGPDAPLSFRGDTLDTLSAETREWLDRFERTKSRVADDIAPDVPLEDQARALALGRVETGSGDVYVNWGRIETPEDVKGVIQQLADADSAGVEAARRGTRTNAETAQSADQVNAWAMLVERRQGETMNAEQTLAMRRLWTASGEKLLEAARLSQRVPTPENLFLFRRAVALHGTVQREVIAVRTETARALQQWSIPAGSSAMASRQMQETVERFGSADVADDLARRIIALAEGGDIGAIDQLTRRGAGAATLDAVHEYWIMGLLSGPKTHMVNAMSNTGVVFLTQMERATAAGLGAARGSSDAIELAEAGAMMHGMVASLPDAFRFAAENWKTGGSNYGLQRVELQRTRAISTESLGNTRNEAFNRVINLPAVAHGLNAFGAVMAVPGRALGTADEFFKTINFRMEVHASAVRQATAEAREGRIGRDGIKARMAELIENPDEATVLAAREFAKYATFTNDAGWFARGATQLGNKMPITRFVMPFVNTIANILRFSVERSPGAPLLGDVRADIRAGGARGDMALARMGLGSVAMLTAFDMSMNGQITGSGPIKFNEVQSLRRQGWQPYSVKIGDRWFAYNRLDPLGMQLGVAANMSQMALNSDLDPGEDYDEAVYRSIGAVGQMMLDKTFFQGVAQLFSAMSNPQRFAPTYFEKLAGSFIPTFVNEIKMAQDPVLRQASDTLERLQSRIPGLSDNLAPRHDLWGRPISFQSGLGKGFDAVSPIYASRIRPEPIDLEFDKINFFPGMPSKTVTVDREAFSLRNNIAVYEEYVVLQGATAASSFAPVLTARGDLTAVSQRMSEHGDRTLRETLNDLVTGQHPWSPEYDQASDQDREDMLARTIGDFRSVARDKIIETHPDVFAPGRGKR